MISESRAGKSQQVIEILQKLNLKSVEELFNADHFNIQNLAKSNSLHPLVVENLLHRLQAAITQAYAHCSFQKHIEFQDIFERWRGKATEEKEMRCNWMVEGSDIIQIISRVNGGKSYLLNELVLQSIKKGKKVIYLDNNSNFLKLKYKINSELKQTNQIWLKHFQFQTMSQLCMLLHSVGTHLSNSNSDYILCIDSLCKSEQPQLENAQATNSLQYKSVQKFKKLIIQLAQNIGSVIYVNKSNNYNGLFDNQYKSQKHRPKCFGSTSKQWDSIANKTICVDFTRTKDKKQHWRLLTTKSMETKFIELTRYYK